MIKTTKISESIINELPELFSSRVFDLCFKKGMWISGGFARKIGHLCLGLDKQKPIDSVIRYFGSMHTDIDFYSSNIEAIKSVSKFSNPCDLQMESYDYDSRSAFYKTPFASNVDLEFRKLERVNRSFGYIPIQLVTKFLFKGVSSCFESTDITNCKYAITKEGDSYKLHFDSKALDYDLKKELHINHTKSPYTISRIRKYIKDSNRGIVALSKDPENTTRFHELLYKIIENKWPEVYNMQTADFVLDSLRNLSDVHSLTNFELSLFIGKLTETICTSTEKIKHDSGYGVFINYAYEERDWASNVIKSRAK